jgi:hypothetical protein
MPEMEVEKAAEFGDGFGELTGAMGPGDDFFRCGGLQVGAPIGDDAVGAVGGIPLAGIPDDGVVGDGDGPAVEDLVGGIAR